MATKIGSFNLTIPAWELTDLDTLSKQGDLSGVNPDILAVMDQSESSGEGGGVASNGDGGWYGLQSSATYTSPSGTAFKTTPSLISGTSEQDFELQSETAAAEIAHLIDEYGGNVTEAEEKYQGGSTEGANNLASAGLAGPVSSSSLASDQATGTEAGLSSGNDNAGTGGSTVGATDTGASAIWQELNDLLNPSGGGLITQLTTLGTSDIAAVVEMIFVRGIFAVGFLLLAYSGFKTLSGSGGGSSQSVISLLQPGPQDTSADRVQLASGRLELAQQREARLSQPTPPRQPSPPPEHVVQRVKVQQQNAETAKRREDRLSGAALTPAGDVVEEGIDLI